MQSFLETNSGLRPSGYVIPANINYKKCLHGLLFKKNTVYVKSCYNFLTFFIFYLFFKLKFTEKEKKDVINAVILKYKKNY